jgi:hypothetical protein
MPPTNHETDRDLLRDLVLPTVLFAALGGMTWAVRGSSGFGALKGCVFAGVTWGAAWWLMSIDPSERTQRRYSSGWIILALAVGIGISGARGWMQWPSFFEGKLLTNYGKGEFVPISRAYGFLWLFIAGVPWAGLGACLLAWCGAGRPLRFWEWALRIGCGFAASWLLGDFLFNRFPDVFLPLHSALTDRYSDLSANPNLRRLIGDNHLAMRHLGFYLGFLFFEAARRDWKNVTLILTVGLLNGLGWALCQNWKWAPSLWPNANVNFWRCWESSGGISIGLAYGIAFYLVNRPMALAEPSYPSRPRAESLVIFLGLLALFTVFFAGELRGWSGWFAALLALFAILSSFKDRSNLDSLGVYLGLLLGLGLSLKNGLRGWANIYPKMFPEGERYWGQVFWRYVGPLMLLALIAILLRELFSRDNRKITAKRAFGLMIVVLLVQNTIAQMITGPLGEARELHFNIYYLILMLISSAIVVHTHRARSFRTLAAGSVSEKNAGNL